MRLPSSFKHHIETLLSLHTPKPRFAWGISKYALHSCSVLQTSKTLLTTLLSMELKLEMHTFIDNPQMLPHSKSRRTVSTHEIEISRNGGKNTRRPPLLSPIICPISWCKIKETCSIHIKKLSLPNPTRNRSLLKDLKLRNNKCVTFNPQWSTNIRRLEV